VQQPYYAEEQVETAERPHEDNVAETKDAAVQRLYTADFDLAQVRQIHLQTQVA
jgi:hypothetical protein